MSSPLNTRKDANMETNRDTILQAAANGNAGALEFLRCFARRAHWVDDLVDETKAGGSVDCGETAKAEADWLVCLASNPFFLAHRAQLVPAMVLALNAWVDSNRATTEAEQGGVNGLRQWAAQMDVLKGQWHEVVWLVAWLTGGWAKLRETSSRFRDYDFEPQQGMSGGTPADTRETRVLPSCLGCGATLTAQCFPWNGLEFCGIPCAEAFRRKAVDAVTTKPAAQEWRAGTIAEPVSVMNPTRKEANGTLR